MGLPVLAVLAVGIFIARPLSILISSIGTSVTLREGTLLAWIAPRGIVAAAISSWFALRLEGQVENAALLVPMTFVMIIGTVVIQGLTAGSLAQWLGLSSRGEQGVLITSSNKVALVLGEALLSNGIAVKMVDKRREGLQEARMLGMKTFYGSPLSEHADRFLELSGFTHLFALSRNAEANAMVCARYRHDFGPENVFAVQPIRTDETDSRQAFVQGLRAYILFGSDASWARLASQIGRGATVHSTKLTEEYDYEALLASQDKEVIKLFAIDEDGRLHVFSNHHDLEPGPGWVIASLMNAPEN
jgi:hypothetical protein